MLLYTLVTSLILTLFYILHCSDITPIIAYISYCAITAILFLIAGLIGNPYILTPILYLALVLIVNCIIPHL